MRELRQIYCKTLNDLPTLEVIENELKVHDRIRIDYDINSKFKSSRKLKKYIQSINHNLNVEIHKGEFRELEFYNIYSLFTELEINKFSIQLEEAIKDYRILSEKLIKQFEEKYDYSFSYIKRSFSEIREKLEMDKNMLSENWTFNFHGGNICFSNSKTGQVVDINLKFDGYYGVLDLWFFQYYMKTTQKFESLS